jgi:hypothetical protein
MTYIVGPETENGPSKQGQLKKRDALVERIGLFQKRIHPKEVANVA